MKAQKEGEVDCCDSCGRMAQGKDTFKQFTFFSPDGKPMIARKSDPKMPAETCACPACEDKVKAVMMNRDPSGLPPGRLKRVLERIKTRETLKRLRLH